MLLRTLGGASVPDHPFRRHKPLLLLAYLAIEGPQDRRYVAELFWPEADSPRQNLAVAVSQIRKGLPGSLLNDGTHIVTTVECDAVMFQNAVAAHAWSEAVKLYKGEFVAGVDASDGNVELQEWVYRMREGFAGLAVLSLVELAERAQRASDLRSMGPLARRALTERSVASELSTDLLHRLYAVALSTHSPSAVDLEEELLMRGAEVPSRDETTAPHIDSRFRFPELPTPSSKFIGRANELLALRTALASQPRMITVTGIGGVGKTTTVLELGRELLADGLYDDVLFVSFDTVTMSDDIASHLRSTLAPEVVSVDALQVLAKMFHGSRVLLILDGFEHLIGNASQVSALLAACPNLTVLVTSREPLHCAEEAIHPLMGLTLPADPLTDATDPEAYDGLRLFAERARKVSPTFVLDASNVPSITEACSLVGGSPLGIELAAALADSFSPVDLLTLIRGDVEALVDPLPGDGEHPRSLRGILDSTWARLNEEERAALSACAAFKDGFRLEAGTIVAGLSLKTIKSLIEKSALSRSDSRYYLHPLVRQYVTERLNASGVAESVYERHAHYYGSLVASKEPYDMASGQREAFDELATDYANVRAAWDWAVTNRETRLLERMTHMFARFLYDRRSVSESTALLEAGRSVTHRASPLHSRLSRALGRITSSQAPYKARDYLQDALDVATALGRRSDAGATMNLLALIYKREGELEKARELLADAISFLTEHDGERQLGGCYANLALVTPDRDEAERLTSLGIKVCRANGNVTTLAALLNNRAVALTDDGGNATEAYEYVSEGLQIEYAEGRRPHLLARLHKSAITCLLELGDYHAAEEHLTRLERALEEQRWDTPDGYRPVNAIRARFGLLWARGELDQARCVAAEAPNDRYLRGMLAWHALMVGDASSLRANLLAFQSLSRLSKPTDGESSRDPASGLLLGAGLFALSRSATENQLSPSGLPLDHTVKSDLLEAIEMVCEISHVSLMLATVNVVHVCAPTLVSRGHLKMVATHRDAPVWLRRWSTILYEAYPSSWPCVLEGVTESLPLAAEPLTAPGLRELLRGLAERLSENDGQEEVRPGP